jgi:hypothetical protein
MVNSLYLWMFHMPITLNNLGASINPEHSMIAALHLSLISPSQFPSGITLANLKGKVKTALITQKI